MSRFILQGEERHPKAVIWLEREGGGQLYLKSRPTDEEDPEEWYILEIMPDGTLALCGGVTTTSGFQTADDEHVIITKQGKSI